MHIAILVANTDESAFADRWPKDGEKFATLLHEVRPGWRCTAFAATKGVFPQDFTGIDGIIVTGSPASVHDSDPWIGTLMDCLRDAVAKGVPVFGACFGHQAVAMALGGTVGPNPEGWVLGTVGTMIDVAGPIRLYAAHREQVLVPPPGARVTGHTPGCPVAAMRIGDRVLTTQYHPEMTHGFITALVAELDGKLPADVIADARSSLRDPADRARMAGLIAAFFEAQDSAASRSIAVT